MGAARRERRRRRAARGAPAAAPPAPAGRGTPWRPPRTWSRSAAASQACRSPRAPGNSCRGASARGGHESAPPPSAAAPPPAASPRPRRPYMLGGLRSMGTSDTRRGSTPATAAWSITSLPGAARTNNAAAALNVDALLPLDALGECTAARDALTDSCAARRGAFDGLRGPLGASEGAPQIMALGRQLAAPRLGGGVLETGAKPQRTPGCTRGARRGRRGDGRAPGRQTGPPARPARGALSAPQAAGYWHLCRSSSSAAVPPPSGAGGGPTPAPGWTRGRTLSSRAPLAAIVRAYRTCAGRSRPITPVSTSPTV